MCLIYLLLWSHVLHTWHLLWMISCPSEELQKKKKKHDGNELAGQQAQTARTAATSGRTALQQPQHPNHHSPPLLPLWMATSRLEAQA